MSLAPAIVCFVMGAAVLSWAGTWLARAGDELATRTGLGPLAVGAGLVAVATSMPEVVTSVSAAVADAPDVAVGDLLGSSMANMAILGVVDLAHHGRVWPSVELGHVRVASVAIALTAIVALGMLVPGGPALGWIGWQTIVVALGYAAAVRWMRRSPGRSRSAMLPVPTGWADDEDDEDAVDLEPGHRPTAGGADAPGVGGPWRRPGIGRAVRRFAVAATALFVSAPVVAVSGHEIAVETGISEAFVGIAFVAVATSLPEAVAALAAVRIGAHDLAVGNLFGSNAVNVALLLVVDLAYTDGPVLGAVSAAQPVAAVGAIVLMALAAAAIVQGEETRLHRLEPDAVLLLVAYLAATGAVLAVGP